MFLSSKPTGVYSVVQKIVPTICCPNQCREKSYPGEPVPWKNHTLVKGYGFC